MTTIARQIKEDDRMLHISITNLHPSRLWIIRWIVKLCGATAVVCASKKVAGGKVA